MTDSRMRDEDGFLTEHDPEPRFPRNPPEADAIAGRCSKCRENTTFEMDPYEKAPMSVCCWRPLLDPSVAVDSAEGGL